MALRACFVSGAACLLLAAPIARASGGDHDPDQEENAPAATATKPRAAGKPVPFDRAWLTPFFADSRTKKAVDQFRAEDWAGAEAGFAKERERSKRSKQSTDRHGTERLAATYLLGLALANQSKWAEAGDMFESLYKSYPILAPYHAYNAARCRLRRGDATGALDWAAKVPDGSVPKAEAELVRVDALRALGRWTDVLVAVENYLQQ